MAKTTFIEAMLNQELGEPFRRDAMKKPVVVAGINRDDMRPQTRLEQHSPLPDRLGKIARIDPVRRFHPETRAA
jgi:hypothetical protein